MICDSYGRDLGYLRSRVSHKPPRWQFILNLFWPIASIELWNARKMLESHHDRL